MPAHTQESSQFAARPQLEKNPNKLNPEVTQKDSGLNQDLKQTAQWLKDNQDKSGTEEYATKLNDLKSMADKGYPIAEFEYAKFLNEIGEFHQAGLYFDQVRHNHNASADLQKEIAENAPDTQRTDPENGEDKTEPEINPPHLRNTLTKLTENRQQNIIDYIRSVKGNGQG